MIPARYTVMNPLDPPSIVENVPFQAVSRSLPLVEKIFREVRERSTKLYSMVRY